MTNGFYRRLDETWGSGHCDNDVNVRAEWGKSIAKVGLRPVYPMRENLFLGDILLFVHNPCDGGDLTRAPQTMLLGSLPEDQIQQAFERFYGDRPQLPVTPTKSEASSDSANKPKTPTPSSKITINMSSPQTQTVTATNGAPPTAAAGSSGAGSSALSPQNSPATNSKNPIFYKGRQFTRLPMAAIRTLDSS
jgi:hypothetical protein